MAKSLRVQCFSCGATGLYQGFMEAKHQAVICVNCDGTGLNILSGKPFTGRKKRRGITMIRAGSGLIIDQPSDKSWISYVEFERRIKAPAGNP